MSGKRSSDDTKRPVIGYVTLLTVFGTVFGGALAQASRRDLLPDRPSLVDLGLIALAGHKLARLIATDDVTWVVRAPFVELRRDEDGKIAEEPAGRGVRRALGELLTCPSCLGQWTCAAFFTGLLYRPQIARAVASIFATDAASDFLHTAYHAAKERA